PADQQGYARDVWRHRDPGRTPRCPPHAGRTPLVLLGWAASRPAPGSARGGSKMLSEEKGNLLVAPADALVNTVNTVGVMGKGIALQFKQAYPANFRAYAAACRRGEVRLGSMYTTETGLPDGPRYIVNFPTKGHWRSRSRLADVTSGLAGLREVI